MRSTFTRGMGRSTFNCISCGRRTRDTDQGGTDCCMQCYEIAGIDNEINDCGYKPGSPEHSKRLAECEGLLKDIAKKGGDVEKVKASSDYVWVQEVPAVVPTPTLDRAGLAALLGIDPEGLSTRRLRRMLKKRGGA